MPSEAHMTIAAVVGRNVGLTRELRGWTRDQLADEVDLEHEANSETYRKQINRSRGHPNLEMFLKQRLGRPLG